MKSIFVTSVLVLFSAAQASALSFRCFSNSYTFNRSTLMLDADVVSSNELAHVHVVSEDYGIGFDLNRAASMEAPVQYTGYNFYPLGANPGGRNFQPISMLLPGHLEGIRGKFEAYVSDANAVRQAPSNFNRVTCETR